MLTNRSLYSFSIIRVLFRCVYFSLRVSLIQFAIRVRHPMKWKCSPTYDRSNIAIYIKYCTYVVGRGSFLVSKILTIYFCQFLGLMSEL